MEYHYVKETKEQLRKNVDKAEKRLDSYWKAFCSPVGSGAWEGAIHSNDSVKSLEEELRQAQKAYKDFCEFYD